MSPLLLLTTALVWAGATLLLAELRWFARRPLTDRLGPYLPSSLGRRPRVGLLSVASFRELVGPLAHHLGARISRLVGVHDDLDRRLARVHAALDVTAFRVRQIGWSLAAMAAAVVLAVLLAGVVAPAVGVVLVLGAPALAFLVLEQQVTAASERWQRTVRLELPVVAEQLGTLLAAGSSLSAALERVAHRGSGACSRDLARVAARIRQGVAEEQALQEWAELADVEGVDRLVAVLRLNREASDLGRLIATEARAIRRGVHRDLLETIERRGQQVWIPVTVATLLPGAIFLAIPFTQALAGFLG